jgi:hypothetical protein
MNAAQNVETCRHLQDSCLWFPFPYGPQRYICMSAEARLIHLDELTISFSKEPPKECKYFRSLQPQVVSAGITSIEMLKL